MGTWIEHPPKDVSVLQSYDSVTLVLPTTGGLFKQLLDRFFSGLILFALPAASFLIAPLLWVFFLKNAGPLLAELSGPGRFAVYLLSTPGMGLLTWLGMRSPGWIRAWLDRTLSYGFTITLTPIAISPSPRQPVLWSEVRRVNAGNLELLDGRSIPLAPSAPGPQRAWLLVEITRALRRYRSGSRKDVPDALSRLTQSAEHA